MADKNFIGNCKKIQNWGINFGVKKEDLEKAIGNTSGEWVNFTVVPNLNKDDKKPYAYLNDYKKDDPKEDIPLVPTEEVKESDMPF